MSIEKPEQTRPKWIEDTTKETRPIGGRSLGEYEKFLGFQRDELSGKTVIDLGSGPTERFSRELKESGIDVNVISINPDYKSEKQRKEIVTNPEWQKKSVAAIGQELPFQDNSIDEVLGLYSVSWYADTEFEQVLPEVYRVLKPGGVARIGPFIAERLSKDFEKNWKRILSETNLHMEETDERWEEGVLLRLVFQKPNKE
jgi:ubiquinone/menaquinone biosynthesis C-methylase UbiE